MSIARWHIRFHAGVLLLPLLRSSKKALLSCWRYSLIFVESSTEGIAFVLGVNFSYLCRGLLQNALLSC
jgi:hypothetical protein